MVTSLILQTFERRIDNCFDAANRCEEGSWAKVYWINNAMALLRKLNREFNERIR